MYWQCWCGNFCSREGTLQYEREAWVVEFFSVDAIDGYLEHWGAITQPFECREDAYWFMQQHILSTGLHQDDYRVRLVTVPGDQQLLPPGTRVDTLGNTNTDKAEGHLSLKSS
jgi:hypothetical protein